MRPRRDDPHTLAGAYALNALTDRDQARFERHLAGCETCATEVRGLRETAARLATATAAAPPARLRERVLAEVAKTRQQSPAPAEHKPATRSWTRWAVGPSGRRGLVRPLAAGLSVACLAAAVVSGVLALSTKHTLTQAQARDHMLAAVLTAPDAKMMSATVTGGGTASIVMSSREHALAFSSAGLPALPAGQAYELWLMGPPGMRSAAMLPQASHGMTSPVIATGLRTGDMVELTVEPSGGAAHPSAAILLLRV
ncbi:MAG TPA: anti-sigma factor [Streptosporangiaceae bacterium]|jgi:anti-sigma-K factor RskA